MKIKLIIALLIISGLTLAFILTSGSNPPATHSNPQPTVQIPPVPKPVPVASEVVADVNNERVKAGLAPLVDDPLLDASAKAKCDDMVQRDYWSHNTPDGQEPWTFMVAQGVGYKTAGENLEYNSGISSQEVVTDWMASPGHKANILNTSYTHEGLAVCYSGNYTNLGPEYVVVQHFDLPQ